MKRVLLPVFFSFFVSLAVGQSLKKVNSYLSGNNYDKAKTELDAYLQKNPTDGEGLYLKSKIYAKIADSAALRSLVAGDARAEAFDAFQKALADSGNMKVKLALMKDGYSSVFEIYSGYFQDGIDHFSAGAQKQSQDEFTTSMNDFIKADNVGQYIRKAELANIGVVDTTLVLNIAKAALNAKDDKVALEYFTKLADAHINGTRGEVDETFKLPYQWLEFYYKDKGDEANMLKYADLGNKFYPKETYFDFVMIDYYREKKEPLKVLDVYKNLVVQHPDSASYHFSYANDIFGYIYNQDEGKVVQNKDQWMNTLKQELDKALALSPNDINSNWLTSQYFFNKGIETRDDADKLKDAAAKTQMINQSKDYFNKAIPYGEKAISVLDKEGTKADKSRYKSVVNLMQSIYQSLGDKDNLKKYEDLYDGADKKFGDRS